MKFNDLSLDSRILQAISACGYTQATPIQEKAIPLALEGKSLIGCAQTGTGKTAAFVLPALHYLAQQTDKQKKTRILILTPTRELAGQITKAASSYGKFLKYNIVSLVGGMPYPQQIRDLQRGADIIVATPGRLMDHIDAKRVDLSHVDILVLDEADRMLDMGFIDDVEYIAKLTPSKRQTLLFSATVDKQLAAVVRNLVKDPVRIDISSQTVAAPKIKQTIYKTTSAHHKTRLLKHFLNNDAVYKAIVFTATKMNADRLADELCDAGFEAAALHGDLRQNVRNRIVQKLQDDRRGALRIVVATDVAARGLHVDNITHVINFDLPKFCEDYVHRIGRTGRAGKEGTAISFVSSTDTRVLQKIERYIGQRIQLGHIHPSEINDGTKVVSEKFEDGGEILGLNNKSRAERFYDDEFREDKKPAGRRSFARDRNESSDRPAKRFSRESDARSSRDASDRPARRFSKDGAARPSRDASDRPTKRFSKEASDTRFSRDTSDRPAKRFSKEGGDARFARDTSDRPAKRFSKEGSDARPSRDRDTSSKPGKRFSKDGDAKKSFTYKSDSAKPRGRSTAASKDGNAPFKKRSPAKGKSDRARA